MRLAILCAWVVVMWPSMLALHVLALVLVVVGGTVRLAGSLVDLLVVYLSSLDKQLRIDLGFTPLDAEGSYRCDE